MINNSVLDAVAVDSPQWFQREYQFVSLMEILRLYAERYCRLSGNAVLLCSNLDLFDNGFPNGALVEEMIGPFIQRLYEMKEESERLGLTATRDAIKLALSRAGTGADFTAFSQLCGYVPLALEEELKGKVCFILPGCSQDFYTRPLEGWEPILEVFPEAQDDVEQMNRCRAFGCESAAVFHVLLVVEFGLIALGKFLGVSDHKPGWDATCNAIEKILKEGRGVVAPTILQHFAFLEQINKDMQSMKMAWRNKVSHAANNLRLLTSDFKPEVANKIITSVHGFMLLLATEGPLRKENEVH